MNLSTHRLDEAIRFGYGEVGVRLLVSFLLSFLLFSSLFFSFFSLLFSLLKAPVF